MTGPVGSGKTTEAKLLSEYLGVPLIKTGELLRSEAETKSNLGEQLKKVIYTGELIDDDIVIELVKREIERVGNSFILDCYPRRMSELEKFDPKIDYVIYLDLPEEDSVKRLTQRGRPDDKPEVIKKRWQVYKEETEPLLEYYRQQGKLFEIDGSGSIEQVQDRIRKFFK